MSDTPEKVLYSPGRRVEVKSLGLAATVYPIGIKHFQRYSDKLAGAIEHIVTMRITKGGPVDARLQYALKMIPYVVMNLLDLVRECTVFADGVDVERLPHWAWPPIVEAWIAENFDSEEKLRPWVAMAEAKLTALMERFVPISETVSKALSPLDTGSKTSSIASQEAPTPTKDGASAN